MLGKSELCKIDGLRIGGDGRLGVCGGSDGGAGGRIDRTGKPSSVETFTVAGGLDRASATTLSEPGVCLRSVVNSDTKASGAAGARTVAA